MSRILATGLALTLCGCTAPGLAHLSTYHDPPDETTTGSSSSSTTSASQADPGSTSDPDSDSGASDGASTSTSSTSTATTDFLNTTTTTGGVSPSCGDGHVDAGEECDDANDVADDACDACVRPRLAFTTSQLFSPKLIAGLSGADNICRQLALQSGHERWTTFVAWLSDSTTDARDRLTPAPGRYVRADGVTVAEDFEQLLSGSLSAPIDLDELGQPAPGDVWTGTRPDGTAVPDAEHCDDWTTNVVVEFTGYLGINAATDESWTLDEAPNVNPTSCALSSHLYCFEGA